MPITLITGPANAGKAQLVMDAVRRQLAHGEEPLLVVPTRADAEHYLRELAGDGAAMGVRVERFDGPDRRGCPPRRRSRSRSLRALARERVLAAIAGAARARRAPPGLRARARGAVRRAAGAARGAGGARPGAVGLGGGGRRARLARASSGDCSPSTARRSSGSGARRRAARGARAGRAAAAPARCGTRTPVLSLRLRRPHAAAARRDRDARPGGRRRGDRVARAYEPGRTAFAGRAATLPRARAARERASPAAGARRALRAAARAPRSATSSARCSSRTPRACAAGARCACSRAAASAPSSSWSASEIAALLRGGMAPEEIAVAGARAGLAPRTCSKRSSPPRASRTRCSGAGAFADTALGRRAARAAALRAAQRHGSPAAASSATCSLAARARACSSARELRRPRSIGWRRARRDGRPQRRAARGAVGGAQLAAGDDRPAARGRSGAARRRCSSAPRASSSGCSARRGAARRARARAPTSSTRRARSPPAAARWRELRELARIGARARARGARASSRARSSGVEFVSGERPAPGAVAVLDPLALRARRVRALFVCGLQEGVFPAPRAAAGVPRRGGAPAAGRDLGAAPRRARGSRSRPSATCSTRPSRAPRSCSC